LAKVGGTTYQNDKSSELWKYNATVTGVTLELEEYNNGAWATIVNLTDDTYGEYFAYDFYHQTLNDLAYVGYRIDWLNVLTIQGEGTFRIKTVETLMVGGTTNRYSKEYCLKTYTAHRAQGTIRLEFWNNGSLADKNSTGYVNRFDFGQDIASNGLGWYNQLRINGTFGSEINPERVNDYVRYTNGQQVYTTETQKAEFAFSSEGSSYPAWLHKLLKIEAMQSNLLVLTNYDVDATDDFVDMPVKMKGTYEPIWNKNISKLAFLKLTFEPEYDNLLKRRC
jgi:hypothetical protein